MGILDRYILRETMAAWVGVSVVLSLILMGNVIAKLMYDVSEGKIEAGALLPFIGASTLELLVTVIPLGVLLGTIMALGRLYRDSEMVAMTACGLGPWQLLRSVCIASLIPLSLSAAMSLYISPLSNQYQNQVLLELERESRFEKLDAGQFISTGDKQSVFYTESINRDNGTLGQIFIRSYSSSGADEVETASSAYYQFDEVRNQDYLVLDGGQHISTEKETGEVTVIDYTHHGIALPQSEAARRSDNPKSKDTAALFTSTELKDRVEFHWRIALPLAVPALALLAVPLSHTAPRKSPYGRIAIGVIVYIVFANLLAVGRRSALKEDIEPDWVMYLPHIIVMIVAGVVISKQLGYWRRQLKPVVQTG